MVTTQAVPYGQETQLEVWAQRFSSHRDRALAGHAGRLIYGPKTHEGKYMCSMFKVLRHSRILRVDIF